MAFYRRARARALPINAGVPEFRKAIEDLNYVVQNSKEMGDEKTLYFSMKEKNRV